MTSFDAFGRCASCEWATRLVISPHGRADGNDREVHCQITGQIYRGSARIVECSEHSLPREHVETNRCGCGRLKPVDSAKCAVCDAD